MIEVTGLDEMRERLTRLEADVRQKIVLKAVKAGAKVIGDAMTESAPVLDEKTAGSDALDPGSLRDGIKITEHLDKDGFATAIIGPNKRTAHVARWVEYGHREVVGGTSKVLADGKTRGSGREIGHVPAHPFLRPAFECSEAEAIEKFKDTMEAELGGALK